MDYDRPSFPSLFIALLVGIIINAPQAQAQYTTKIIIRSGQDAPGIPGAKIPAGAPSGIGLSDSGKALISGFLEMGTGGITAQNNEAVWIYESDSVRLLAQKGGSVPRFTGVRFLNDRRPNGFMDPVGNIGLDGFYSPDGTTTNSVHAFFIEENEVMFQKLFTSMIFPTGDTLTKMNIRAFNNNKVLFTGTIRGPTVQGLEDDVLCEYSAGTVSILIQVGKPMPVIGNGWVVFRFFWKPIITADGKTIFEVEATKSGDRSGVVYTWDPVAGHATLRVSAIGNTFHVFGDYRLNSQGDNVNLSWETFNTTRGLFDTNDRLITLEGAMAAGTGGATFSSFIDFALFDIDTAVFTARTSDGRIGIWFGDINGTSNIVLTGDIAPGLPGNGRFFNVNDIELNRKGDIVFSDRVFDAATGVEVGGVWSARVGRPLRLAISPNDRVSDTNGVLLTIKNPNTTNGFTPRTGADGGMSVLNNNGDFLFGAQFVEGGRALLMATLGGLVVNSNGDAPDADTTDNICDTGNDLPDGRPECTLRAAIMEANARNDSSIVEFNIEGNTIVTPQSPLPSIRDHITIDGSTQLNNNPIIIDGSNAGAGVNGFEIIGSGNIIAGLEIGRFSANGIRISGSIQKFADSNIVIDCYIGIRSDSPMAFGNFSDGVRLGFARKNYIGKPDLDFGGTIIGGWNYISGNLGNGIDIGVMTGGNSVQHNVIGLAQDGSKRANASNGVSVRDSDSTIIGGSALQERNIISGNSGDGIILGSGSLFSKVVNNFIGLTVDGQAAGNLGIGILVSSDSIVIGGGIDSGNVISDNFSGGIELDESVGSQISGNYIGVDTTGMIAIGNNSSGVLLNGSSNTFVSGNIISGNDSAGIDILPGDLSPSRNNTVIDNLIGVGADTTVALPNIWGIRVDESPHTMIDRNHIKENKRSGVLLFSDSSEVLLNRIERNGFIAVPGLGPAVGDGIVVGGKDNVIAGAQVFGTQTIANNNGVGVTVIADSSFSTSHNLIQFNSIWGNILGGIDLDPAGKNTNDPLDTDIGPNDGQNAPELFSAILNDSSEIVIKGILKSKPDERFIIDAYGNDFCDPSGLGQGKAWIGQGSVLTDSLGIATFEFMTLTLASPPAFVTLLAIDSLNNTSEFSNCRIASDKSVDLIVNKSDETDTTVVGDLLRYVITVTNQGTDTATTVTLVDSLPQEINYVADTSDHGPCLLVDGHLTCDLGTMPPGDSATVILMANVNSAGLVVNEALAFAAEGDVNPVDNFHSDSTLILSICCLGSTGNIDCDPAGIIDIADLTTLVGHLFIGLQPLCCKAEGNIDGDPAGEVTLADLTKLIDHLFISLQPTASCK